ncbi:MAG: hypothetical protein QOF85_2699 [Solirubrobacterales bacterium]|nr:hypothetical protein [Frankiaceae bacterium]MDX6610746.1 hypothetical protein [Solirubrobacterales bacterium]
MGNPNAVMAGMMQCTFGVAPSTLVVIPKGPPVIIEGRPAATILDMAPMANIPPFGVCNSLANPLVAAATAAALGVLTPMPCTPIPAGPWKPGAVKTMINGSPALTAGCTLNCAFGGGVISIVNPGATMTTSG